MDFKKVKAKIIDYWINRSNIKSFRKFIRETKQITSDKKSSKKCGLVVVPCDPFSIVGSRGDEAMIEVAIRQFLSKYPGERVFFVGNEMFKGKSLKEVFPDVDIEYYPCVIGANWALKVIEHIGKKNPREVIIPGADCMDGAWSLNLSTNLLGVYLMSKSMGIETRLLGFSYNERPSGLINRTFRKLGHREIFNLRDNKSLERFKGYTNCKAELVADSAFLLKPDIENDIYRDVHAKISELREKGAKCIIGFNFHPMLRQYTSGDEIENDALQMSLILEKVLSDYKDVAILLLPHDDRNQVSDNRMLSPIYAKLRDSEVGERIIYINTVPRARQIKGIVGLLDGVITSRMHLGVASLGMGVPVMAATYQGKFDGLFEHFSLSTNLILMPEDFLDFNKFNEGIKVLIRDRDSLKRKIDERRTEIMELAKRNFA